MKFLSLFLIILLGNEIFVKAEGDTKKLTKSKTSRPKRMSIPIIAQIFGFYKPTVIDETKRITSTRSGSRDVKEEYDARREYPQCYTIDTITIQGWCFSCWAIAVANAFSDRICIKSNGKKNYSMSIQQLLACSEENNGCKGGDLYLAWKFLETFPLVTGGPYLSKSERKERSKYVGRLGVNDGCQSYLIPSSPSLAYFKKQVCSREMCEVTHKAKDIIKLPNDEFEIRREIQNYGPVTAVIAVYPSFYSYKGGIYRKKKDEKLQMYHGVRIIGWGKTKKTEKEPELEYWIVANSPVDDLPWGENGTFRILRGKDECRIESFVSSGLPVFDEDE